MSNKRYYWLKLKDDFFEDDTIQWLEEQENGKDYVIFYLKLALKSLTDNGSLIRYVGEKLIPYDVKALSKLTNTPVDTVAVAMKTFEQIGLINVSEIGEIYLNQIDELIGSETDSAVRMRKSRLKNALNSGLIEEVSHCDRDVQKCDTDIDIEKELDIEKERESKKVRSQEMKLGSYKNVRLTQKELDKLNEVYPEFTEKYIEDLSLYLAQTGKRYKSHSATIQNWIRRDLQNGKIKQPTKRSSTYGNTY